MENETALLIAKIALGVSAVSFAWTMVWSLVNYRFLGARLRVSLALGLLTHRGTVATFTSPRRWPTRPMGGSPIREDDLWIEVVKITVANTGRTVAWISDLGLDFGRVGHWPTRRRRRLAMSLRPLAVAGGRGDANTPIRLEPGEFTWIFVPALDAVRWAAQESSRRRQRVRGSATFGGQRIVRSPRRRSWRVTPDSAAYPHLPVTTQVRLYRELLTAWPDSDLSKLYETLLEVWVILEDPHRGSLDDVLEPFVPNLMARLALVQRLKEIGAPRSL